MRYDAFPGLEKNNADFFGGRVTFVSFYRLTANPRYDGGRITPIISPRWRPPPFSCVILKSPEGRIDARPATMMKYDKDDVKES